MNIFKHCVFFLEMFCCAFTATTFSCWLFVGLLCISFCIYLFKAKSICCWVEIRAVALSINTSDQVPLADIHANAITSPPLCLTDDVLRFRPWAISLFLLTFAFCTRLLIWPVVKFLRSLREVNFNLTMATLGVKSKSFIFWRCKEIIKKISSPGH